VKVYVAFRSKHPDEATIKDVLKELQDNNIDVSKLAISRTDHCQKEESSTSGGISEIVAREMERKLLLFQTLWANE